MLNNVRQILTAFETIPANQPVIKQDRTTTNPKDAVSQFYRPTLIAAAEQTETDKIADNYKPDYEYINDQLGKFTTVQMPFDASALSPGYKKVLANLKQVGEYTQQIYYRQIYSQNEQIHAQLIERAKSGKKEDVAALKFFEFNSGPFDIGNVTEDGKFRTFIGTKSCPDGANFYPEDMTKEEFENWIKNHPEDKDAFLSPYTVIKRNGGKLVAIPYQVEYKKELELMANLLDEAALAIEKENHGLNLYFRAVAIAFRTTEFPASDKALRDADRAWVRLSKYPNQKFEIILGPQEAYRDRIFGLKTAFEVHIITRDPEKEEQKKELSKDWPKLAKNMPISEELKAEFVFQPSNPPEAGKEIYIKGDGQRPVPMGIGLPNNADVIEDTGSKQIIITNTMEAKFNSAFMPIAMTLVDPGLHKYYKSEKCVKAYSDWVSSHELSHGIVPKKSIYETLKEHASTIEEAKADALGLLTLIQSGKYTKDDIEYFSANFLAETFRTIQYGSQPAHRTGGLIHFNWMIEKNIFIYDEKTKRYTIDLSPAGLKKFEAALSGLVKELLEIEATGNYERVGALIKNYGTVKPSYLKESLTTIKGIVKDIIPEFNIQNLE